MKAQIFQHSYLVLVRVPDSENFIEHILLSRPLPQRVTVEENFKVIDDFFREHYILWSWCVEICPDDAAAMTGRTVVLIARRKKKYNFMEDSE